MDSTLQCRLSKVYLISNEANYAERFLIDSLGFYPEMKNLLDKINCRFAYIADTVYYDAKNICELKNYIFLRIDVKGKVFFNEREKRPEYVSRDALSIFNNTLEKIKLHKSYIYDYPESVDNKITNFHFIVLELPRPDLMSKMVAGKFSTMYPEKDISVFDKETQDIFLKKDEAKEKFKNAISLKYGVNINFVDTSGELFPSMIKEDWENAIRNYYSGFLESIGIKKDFETKKND